MTVPICSIILQHITISQCRSLFTGIWITQYNIHPNPNNLYISQWFPDYQSHSSKYKSANRKSLKSRSKITFIKIQITHQESLISRSKITFIQIQITYQESLKSRSLSSLDISVLTWVSILAGMISRQMSYCWSR